MPIASHMAAEGVEADLPTFHRMHLLSESAFSLVVLVAAANRVLEVLDAVDD
jgi:hypothetical protein